MPNTNDHAQECPVRAGLENAAGRVESALMCSADANWGGVDWAQRLEIMRTALASPCPHTGECPTCSELVDAVLRVAGKNAANILPADKFVALRKIVLERDQLRKELATAERARDEAIRQVGEQAREMGRMQAELEAAKAREATAHAEAAARIKQNVTQIEIHQRNTVEWNKALAAARAEVRELVAWLMGEEGEFPARPEGAGLFWWRKELRERAAALVAKHQEVQG